MKLLIIITLFLTTQFSLAQERPEYDFDLEQQRQDQEDAAREAQMMQDQEPPVEPIEPADEHQGSLQDSYEQPEFIQ